MVFRRCAVVVAVLLLCAAALALPQVFDRAPLFTGAEQYTFYAGSQSSNARIVLCEGGQAARVRRGLGALSGESARYASAEDAFAQVRRLGGELLFREEAAGTVNYYYRSRRLTGGVSLGGKTVNLHVAVRGAGACVGSPIIFGGY